MLHGAKKDDDTQNGAAGHFHFQFFELAGAGGFGRIRQVIQNLSQKLITMIDNRFFQGFESLPFGGMSYRCPACGQVNGGFLNAGDFFQSVFHPLDTGRACHSAYGNGNFVPAQRSPLGFSKGFIAQIAHLDLQLVDVHAIGVVFDQRFLRGEINCNIEHAGCAAQPFLHPPDTRGAGHSVNI